MSLAEKLREFLGYPGDGDAYEEDAPPQTGPDRAEKSAPGPATVALMKPQRFEDARAAADHLGANRMVLLNLDGLNPDTARRMVNFLCGAAYAKSGTVRRVSGGIYLVAPYFVEVNDEGDPFPNFY